MVSPLCEVTTGAGRFGVGGRECSRSEGDVPMEDSPASPTEEGHVRTHFYKILIDLEVWFTQVRPARCR
jgi:hypothetical protein